MVSFGAYDRHASQTASLGGPMRNSTFARYRSVEAAAEARMRVQREARLQQLHANLAQSANAPFIGNARMPQRWTDE